jgi:hypothetical protein
MDTYITKKVNEKMAKKAIINMNKNAKLLSRYSKEKFYYFADGCEIWRHDETL